MAQRGVKGEAVTAYARVEFGKTLGETNKAEIGPDGITKFNFNASIEVNLDDPSAIDEICHRYVYLVINPHHNEREILGYHIPI